MATLEKPSPAASLLARLGWTQADTARGVLTWSGQVLEEGVPTHQQAWIRWVGVSLEAQLYVRNPAGPSRLLNLHWDVNPFGGAQLTNCRDVHGVLEVGRAMTQFREAVGALGCPSFVSASPKRRPC